jgi:hypothetical protein
VIHITRERIPSNDSGPVREIKEDFIQTQHKAVSSLLATSQPKTFYASDSDGLGLAGADVFSPAASEPSSPTISRKVFLLEGETTEGVEM